MSGYIRRCSLILSLPALCLSNTMVVPRSRSERTHLSEDLFHVFLEIPHPRLAAIPTDQRFHRPRIDPQTRRYSDHVSLTATITITIAITVAITVVAASGVNAVVAVGVGGGEAGGAEGVGDEVIFADAPFLGKVVPGFKKRGL